MDYFRVFVVIAIVTGVVLCFRLYAQIYGRVISNAVRDMYDLGVKHGKEKEAYAIRKAMNDFEQMWLTYFPEEKIMSNTVWTSWCSKMDRDFSICKDLEDMAKFSTERLDVIRSVEKKIEELKAKKDKES